MKEVFELRSNIRNVIEILEKLFSDPFIKYDITYCKHRYNFTDPIFQEDKDKLAKQREQLIKAMLKKSINKYIDIHYKYKDIDEDYSDPSFDFINDMISMHATDLAISVPVGEKYEIGIDELDNSLDLERVEIDGKDSLILKRIKPCKCYGLQEAEMAIECDGKCTEKVKGTENVVSENK
jgi:hypothetical protein